MHRYIFVGPMVALALLAMHACITEEGSERTCRNGILDPGEECDDGNADNTDGCTNTCKIARCGDTFVRAGVEQCDDGNTTSGDGCSSVCLLEAEADADTDADTDGDVDADTDMDVGPWCGNGVIETGEECDDGNDVSGDGCENDCNWTCEAVTQKTDCDDSLLCTDNICDESTHTCSNPVSSAGTVCRSAAGDCDVEEQCDGVSATCPDDVFLPGTHECRVPAGVCDVAENCTGLSADCPPDSFRPNTYECRASAGLCDVVESCMGSSATCPADAFALAATACRPSAGVCDVAENCTGLSADCPPDSFRPNTYECRASTSLCDVAEYCNGTDRTCPADTFASADVTCRADFDDCDVAENCPGDGPNCPDDALQPDFTPCEVITDPDRDYDICIDGECRSPGCGDESCNPPGPHFPLPDTNQRLCYDDAGEIACAGTPGDPSCATTDWCGQDAQYGWDTAHEATERYTVSGSAEPIVTDNVTGLEWQGCPAGQSGSDCAGGSTSSMNWEDAVSFCDGLTWAGHEDWHLPDRYELQSIVDYGRLFPSIDVTAFPGMPLTSFWLSSSYAGSPSLAWYVSFNFGCVSYNAKANVYAVRCVRFGQPALERFTRFGTDEPMVLDNVTGLMWQGCAAGKSGIYCTGSYNTYTWHDALSYCEGLNWTDHEDWRLPDIKELASIVDDHRTYPSIDTSTFPRTPSTWLWSSSSYASSPSSAPLVSFVSGDVGTISDKVNVYAVRCVRSGP